jgi:alkylation response protein AidB-like acyl-CoA dehydrogenase
MTGFEDFDEVTLDGVDVPASGLLGRVGDGWSVAMSTLTHERNHIGASVMGLQRRLAGAVELAGRKRAEGSERSCIDEALRLWSAGEAAAAMANEPDRIGPAAASLMKLAVGEASFELAHLATRLAGPSGQLAGAISETLLASVAARIAGGSSQVQRSIIAERLLGLPREPSPAAPR